MFFFAEFLDAMTEPLAEADGHARVAIDDRIEILARDFQEHRIVQGLDIRPVRLAAEQWHLAETIAVAVCREDTVAPALEFRVRLQSARNDSVQRVARVIFAHDEVAFFDRDELGPFGEPLDQLLAKAGQNRHAFKYLELVLHSQSLR